MISYSYKILKKSNLCNKWNTTFKKISVVIFGFLQFRKKCNFLETKQPSSVICILFALYIEIILMMN